MAFSLLDDFNCRRLQPGEAISMYVHDLRNFLMHAIPNMETSNKGATTVTSIFDRNSRTETIAKQLRASGEVTTLDPATYCMCKIVNDSRL